MKNELLIVFLALTILSSTVFVESVVVRIIDFKSPAKLGEFYDFKYYLRDISGMGDEIIVNFYLEKDEQIISSGTDNFFLESSNRTINSKIFLPSDLESGYYNFKIRAIHGDKIVESDRLIQVDVTNGFAGIDENNLRDNVMIILLTLFAILNLGLIYHIEKDKIGRIFNFMEVLASEGVFLKRHRFTILTFSFFLTFGVLIYYLDYMERLPKTFANVGYFILAVLAVLMLARIIYDKFFSEKLTIRTISDKSIGKKSSPGGIWSWLQEDVKFGSKKDEHVLKNEKKTPKKSYSKNSVKQREDKNFSGFP